ncbi:MAG: ABC transporter permease [Patescibacteria group bacterium]
MSLLSLIFKNVLRRKSELAFLLIAIAFGVAAVFILFSLRLGIEQTLFGSSKMQNRLSELTVYGSSGSPFFNFFGAKSKSLNDEAIIQIQKIPHVISVSKSLTYQNLASIELNLAGQKIQTDSLIFGLERHVVAQDLPPQIAWDGSENPIPVLISSKLIDFYNLSLAPGAGLPPLSGETFQGETITILPGFSSFFQNQKTASQKLEGRVVGFSDRTDIIGVTVPLTNVLKLNQEEGISKPIYSKLLVQLDSPEKVPKVTQALEAEGFRVSSIQNELQEVGKTLSSISIILFVLTGMILILAGTMMGVSFWSSLWRRRNELGVLRAIGATRRTLFIMLLGEAAIIGITSAIFGLLLGSAATIFFQKLLVQNFSLTSIATDEIFSRSPLLLLTIGGLTILLSMSAASLPILKILRQTPRELMIL